MLNTDLDRNHFAANRTIRGVLVAIVVVVGGWIQAGRLPRRGNTHRWPDRLTDRGWEKSRLTERQTQRHICTGRTCMQIPVWKCERIVHMWALEDETCMSDQHLLLNFNQWLPVQVWCHGHDLHILQGCVLFFSWPLWIYSSSKNLKHQQPPALQCEILLFLIVDWFFFFPFGLTMRQNKKLKKSALFTRVFLHFIAILEPKINN